MRYGPASISSSTGAAIWCAKEPARTPDAQELEMVKLKEQFEVTKSESPGGAVKVEEPGRRGRQARVRAFARTLALAMLLLPAAAPALAGRAGQKPSAGKVVDAILGVRLGSSAEEAREKLKRYGRSGGAGDDEEEAEREGGRTEAWKLKRSEFSSIAFRADTEGRVQWVTGFVRRGREIPFAKLGDLSAVASMTEQQAVWNVQTTRGNYRLMAKGAEGKARVVHLLSLSGAPER